MVGKNTKSVSTRDKITGAALDVFIQQGFSHTSTRDIAVVAKITQPAMYHHFKDKESVYLEVVNTVGQTTRKRINKVVVQPGNDTSARVHELVNGLFENHPKGIGMFIQDSYPFLTESGKHKLEMLYKMYYIDPLASFFERRDVHLRKTVMPDEAADIFITCMNAAASSFYHVGTRPLNVLEKSDLVLELLFAGLIDYDD